MAATRLRRWVLAQWFAPRPTVFSGLARPLAALYGALARHDRERQLRQGALQAPPPCPVVVVGNLVLGGAGKTPTTLALVEALRRAGHRPGVVSRGHGRADAGAREVDAGTDVAAAGDEPLLIARRARVPVVVGRDRLACARLLGARHPQVDVIVSDDGLQHRRLPRKVEVLVFDARGVGNARLLPAGPLREPFGDRPPPGALVLYTEGVQSTPWPGHLATRRLAGVWPLAAWWQGGTAPGALSSLRGRRLLAMAGLAVPERFFAALESAGLTIDRLPLPDHHDYREPPWPPGTGEVVTTEKDATKLRAWAGAPVRIWVVGLDLSLPEAFVSEVLARLPRRP